MGDADDRKRVRAVIRGIVQGVSYRAAARREAARLGLSGWVRNRADGAVELEAQGSAERVDTLIAWCRVGPPAADVSGVEVEPIEPIEADRDFAIRY
jgi:acylphosphatase